MSDVPVWLVEPDHPALALPSATRINDGARPDRLTWNTFRLLAEWNSDVWVPALLETALGAQNPLSGLEWADATATVWGTDSDVEGSTDVVIEGRHARILVEATFAEDLTVDRLFAGARRALDLDGDHSQSGYVVVVVDAPEDLADRLQDTADADLSDFDRGDTHGLRPDALVHLCGWVTWRDLGTLALDLAEEADPLRAEQVHRLATELQERFPGIEL
jgi:hypothetical protein